MVDMGQMHNKIKIWCITKAWYIQIKSITKVWWIQIKWDNAIKAALSSTTRADECVYFYHEL